MHGSNCHRAATEWGCCRPSSVYDRKCIGMCVVACMHLRRSVEKRFRIWTCGRVGVPARLCVFDIESVRMCMSSERIANTVSQASANIESRVGQVGMRVIKLSVNHGPTLDNPARSIAIAISCVIRSLLLVMHTFLCLLWSANYFV